jgi:hypothetical protein
MLRHSVDTLHQNAVLGRINGHDALRRSAVFTGACNDNDLVALADIELGLETLFHVENEGFSSGLCQ